jgi:hypothetical protein
MRLREFAASQLVEDFRLLFAAQRRAAVRDRREALLRNGAEAKDRARVI